MSDWRHMQIAAHPFHDLLGRFATLEIRRFGSPGAFLVEKGAALDAPTLLLLGPEIPRTLARATKSLSSSRWIRGAPAGHDATPKLG